MPWELPPIVPFGSSSDSSSSPKVERDSPPIETLKATFDLEPFEEYLPPPRTHFLNEDSSSSSSTKSSSTLITPDSQLQLPYVTLTYAQSLDGQISLNPGVQTVLSGAETKTMTHYLRTRFDAIMIGAGTAIADNPGLNSRYDVAGDDGGDDINSLHRQPRPLILDANHRWEPSPDQKVFQLAKRGVGRAPWWIVMRDEQQNEEDVKKKSYETIRQFGGEVLEMEKYKDWEEILTSLMARGIRSVMIEGGGSIIASLLESQNQRFVDSVIVTVAPTWLGRGGVGVSPARSGEKNEARLRDIRWIPLGQDVVLAGRLELDQEST